MEKIGEVNNEDLEKIEKDLGPNEEIKLITGIKSKRINGTHHLVLTNRRTIFWKKGREKLIKETEAYEDFTYPTISRVYIEPKKDYDLFKIEMETGSSDEIMVPKGEGKRIAGILREKQAQ